MASIRYKTCHRCGRKRRFAVEVLKQLAFKTIYQWTCSRGHKSTMEKATLDGVIAMMKHAYRPSVLAALIDKDSPMFAIRARLH